MPENKGNLALVLSGGGARNAYHAGFLCEVARRHPELSFDIMTGASAGAINLSYLAASDRSFPETMDGLSNLWGRIEIDDVFCVNTPSLLGRVGHWGFRLLTANAGRHREPRGMVDTTPLRQLLHRELLTREGPVTGIRKNIKRGALQAVSVAATSYTTGRTVSFVQGYDIENWERANRRSMEVEIGIEHIMASAALPFFFPAVQVGDAWYGDGGIRLTAPLAPAVHLGADRILALSTRAPRTPLEAERRRLPGYPPPAQILGTLLNAIFLDMFDHDALQLERINRLIAELPRERRGRLRPVKLLVIRPSQDLGELAGEYEPRLPRVFRFLMRGLGTRSRGPSDALSLILFQHDYLSRIMEIGRRDAEAHSDTLAEFLETR